MTYCGFVYFEYLPSLRNVRTFTVSNDLRCFIFEDTADCFRDDKARSVCREGVSSILRPRIRGHTIGDMATANRAPTPAVAASCIGRSSACRSR